MSYTPVITCEIADSEDWLRQAIMLAARKMYEHFFSADDPRLELHVGHAKALEKAARAAMWTVEMPLAVMLPIGKCKILWTWPDEDSVSILDASRDGRRVVVKRREAAAQRTS